VISARKSRTLSRLLKVADGAACAGFSGVLDPWSGSM